jgi:hypothetical protein
MAQTAAQRKRRQRARDRARLGDATTRMVEHFFHFFHDTTS